MNSCKEFFDAPLPFPVPSIRWCPCLLESHVDFKSAITSLPRGPRPIEETASTLLTPYFNVQLTRSTFILFLPNRDPTAAPKTALTGTTHKVSNLPINHAKPSPFNARIFTPSQVFNLGLTSR